MCVAEIGFLGKPFNLIKCTYENGYDCEIKLDQFHIEPLICTLSVNL